MPELPEVETICRGISPFILKQEITAIVVRNHKLRWPIPKKLHQLLAKQQLQTITRRGKYILLKTMEGTLIIHLGMSGNLQIKPQNHIATKHEHVSITFNNELALCYEDPRRFGAILWTNKDVLQHPLLKNLGPEPFNKDFTAEYLFNRAKHCKSSIKQFMMNSKIVVGIGNIYANEILFAAKINPLRKANNITLEDYQLIIKKTKELLRHAIKCGGTTIKDYLNGQGKKGLFQNKLKVYGKQEQLCPNCKKNKLKQARIGQRTTVFCPYCQK